MHFLILCLLDVLKSLLVEIHHLNYASLQRLQLISHFLLEHLLDDAEVCTVRDIADGCHNLKLCRTLVDREDTCVAIQTLTLILHDEARTTMHLDSVVSVLVGILRIHALCQRCESIGKT